MNEQIENNSQVYELASIKRRAFGFIIDMSIYLASSVLLTCCFGGGFILVEIFHTFALPCFFGGMTPGKKLLKLEILDKDSNEPSIFRLFARNIFGRFFIYCLLIALLIEYAIDSLYHVDTGISVFFLLFIFIPTFFIFLLLQIIYFIYGYIYLPFRDKDKRAIHDKIAGTKVIYIGNET